MDREQHLLGSDDRAVSPITSRNCLCNHYLFLSLYGAGIPFDIYYSSKSKDINERYIVSVNPVVCIS